MYLDLCLFVGICVGIVGGVANVITRKGLPLLVLVLPLTGPACAGPGPVFEAGDPIPIEAGAGGEAGAAWLESVCTSTVENGGCVEDCD